MDKIHRVFFHELGHFVARWINHLEFGGPRPVEILIYPCKDDPSEYCGHTRPEVPKGVDITFPIPRKRLASYLVSLKYGCIFESYYLGTSIDECWKFHGCQDSRSFDGNLNRYELSDQFDLFHRLDLNYFEKLKAEKSLRGFMNLKPDGYLVEQENGYYSVDIEKLTIDAMPIVHAHGKDYKQLEKVYAEIINLAT